MICSSVRRGFCVDRARTTSVTPGQASLSILVYQQCFMTGVRGISPPQYLETSQIYFIILTPYEQCPGMLATLGLTVTSQEKRNLW